MKIYSMISELAELVEGKIESGQYIHLLDRILRLYPWFNWSVVHNANCQYQVEFR